MSERRYTPESIGRTDSSFALSTQLYRNERAAKGSGRLKIWAAVTDTGEANAIAPGLKLLSENHEIRVLAREAGADSIQNGMSDLMPTRRHFHPSHRLERMTADAVLTGMASNSTLEFLISKAANERGIPVVGIEDYPGAYADAMKEAFDKDPQTRPNRLMVMNDWARNANLAELPWFNPDHVLVTGQPAFDYIATEDRDQMRAELYPQLGLHSEEELVVWMGQRGGTKEAFQLFVDGLIQVKVHFLIPEILALTESPNTVIPIVQDGSSRAVFDAVHSREEVAKLFDQGANLELKEKMAVWKPDGKAGERVASALIDIAMGNR